VIRGRPRNDAHLFGSAERRLLLLLLALPPSRDPRGQYQVRWPAQTSPVWHRDYLMPVIVGGVDQPGLVRLPGSAHVVAGAWWRFFEPAGLPGRGLPCLDAPAGWAAFARMFLNPRRTRAGVSRPGGHPIRDIEGLEGTAAPALYAPAKRTKPASGNAIGSRCFSDLDRLRIAGGQGCGK